MAFETTNTTAGLGLTGKPTGKLELGGNLSYVNEKSVYGQTLDTYAGADSAALLAATGGLPNIQFQQTVLKLFGKYEIDKHSVIAANLVYARALSNDWGLGLERDALYLWRQHHAQHQPEPVTYLCGRDLHLQVLKHIGFCPNPGPT